MMTKEIEKAKEIWQRPKGKHYQYNTTDYYLNYKDDNSVDIFLSASKQPMDWAKNFIALPRPVYIGYIKIWVHSGFWLEFQDLLKGLLPKLNGINAIRISGCSLGGATAQLLSIYLEVNTMIDVLEVNTFGAPKPFSILWNKAGFKHIKYLCRHITQYRINTDIVPNLPFTWLGYKSVGKRIQLKTNREKAKNPIEYVKRLFTDHASYWEILKEKK